MGGDGGVVATNRRYMRGAGNADHTADCSRASSKEIADAERERCQQAMHTCAVSGSNLNLGGSNSSSSSIPSGGDSIVACPYGRLYNREAAVEALLRRMEQQQQQQKQQSDDGGSSTPDIGWHVRGLKDLYPVRFHFIKNHNSKGGSTSNQTVEEYIPTCPVTGMELNGLQPMYLIVKEKKKSKKKKKKDKHDEDNSDEPNVLSEKAIKQMGLDTLQEEYGPFQREDMVRLIPPSGQILKDIQKELEVKRSRTATLSSKSHKKKKRKGNGDGSNNGGSSRKKEKVTNSKPSSQITSSLSSLPDRTGNGTTIDGIRKNVAAAVASSTALSSLFQGSNKTHLSDKEKKNNLFAHNV